MLKREIRKTGMNASVIALGTWVTGGWMWGGADEKESIDAIHAGLDAGINFIDTAPIYGFGYSEEVVGKAVKDRRDKVIIATKCGLVWDKEKGQFYFNSDDLSVTEGESKRKVYKYLGAESIREEVEKSLKRLQTDYIDLYQTHWQVPTTPIEETMSALTKLKEEGKIRAIGVSNATVEQMKQYGDIDSDQEKYNMLARKIEAEGNTSYCAKNNIALLAYSPIAQGLLTGKITADRKFGEGDVRNNKPMFQKEFIEKVNRMLGEFKPLAEKYNANLGQLSLAWTFKQKGITHLLCGARNKEQAIENAKAGKIDLVQDDLDFIDSVYKKYF
ncbi:MAG: aldo/keto reductase [Ignavibacteria bacterium]|jgi:aryl-alcohol dehydrogenase-like predicted oxidoreductase